MHAKDPDEWVTIAIQEEGIPSGSSSSTRASRRGECSSWAAGAAATRIGQAEARQDHAPDHGAAQSTTSPAGSRRWARPRSASSSRSARSASTTPIPTPSPGPNRSRPPPPRRWRGAGSGLAQGGFEGLVDAPLRLAISPHISDDDYPRLGALTQKRITEGRTKVPFLGDLPLVGALFRSTSRDERKTTLYLFVTPHILKDPEFTDLRDLTYRRELEVEALVGEDVSLFDPDFQRRKQRRLPASSRATAASANASASASTPWRRSRGAGSARPRSHSAPPPRARPAGCSGW